MLYVHHDLQIVYRRMIWQNFIGIKSYRPPLFTFHQSVKDYVNSDVQQIFFLSESKQDPRIRTKLTLVCLSVLSSTALRIDPAIPATPATSGIE